MNLELLERVHRDMLDEKNCEREDRSEAEDFRKQQDVECIKYFMEFSKNDIVNVVEELNINNLYYPTLDPPKIFQGLRAQNHAGNTPLDLLIPGTIKLIPKNSVAVKIIKLARLI